ncbi:small multi-drug export protein [Saliphagus infecundisoli]|uniref:Small multi-drug export protein n=1 Tax=Saliphagus infecundisoli TaxID=1849069 RepID=A0ABD5QGP2_9EURY|nr:small multi-drug export protein [Saliphagus infecundisoli]
MDASTLVYSLLPVANTLAGDALLQGGQVREWIAGASGPWRYLLVFVLAAIPWLEILLVIPAGIAIGLDPLLVAGVAFAGNALPIYGIVLAYERLAARFGWGEGEGSKRRERARRVWNSYGLPGLAFAAPVLTGVHLAAVIALGLGARGRSTLGWMTASIAVWTVAITAATVAGVAILGL